MGKKMTYDDWLNAYPAEAANYDVDGRYVTDGSGLRNMKYFLQNRASGLTRNKIVYFLNRAYAHETSDKELAEKISSAIEVTLKIFYKISREKVANVFADFVLNDTSVRWDDVAPTYNKEGNLAVVTGYSSSQKAGINDTETLINAGLTSAGANNEMIFDYFGGIGGNKPSKASLVKLFRGGRSRGDGWEDYDDVIAALSPDSTYAGIPEAGKDTTQTWNLNAGAVSTLFEIDLYTMQAIAAIVVGWEGGAVTETTDESEEGFEGEAQAGNTQLKETINTGPGYPQSEGYDVYSTYTEFKRYPRLKPVMVERGLNQGRTHIAQTGADARMYTRTQDQRGSATGTITGTGYTIGFTFTQGMADYFGADPNTADTNMPYNQYILNGRTMKLPILDDFHWFALAEQKLRSMIPTPSFMSGKDVEDIRVGYDDGNDFKPLGARAGGKKFYENLAKGFNPITIGDERAVGKDITQKIEQCVLLSAMGELQQISEKIRNIYVEIEGNPTDPTSKATTVKVESATAGVDAATSVKVNRIYPYGGRIIPMRLQQNEAFINHLCLPPNTTPQEAIFSARNNRVGNASDPFDVALEKLKKQTSINDYLSCTKYFQSGIELDFGIYKVVQDFKDRKTGKPVNEGRDVELPMFFFDGIPEFDKRGNNPILDMKIKNPTLKRKYRDPKEGMVGPDENAIVLKSVDIDFNGGNTATAKSDVTVTIKYLLSDIRLIEQQFNNKINIINSQGKDEIVNYSFSFLDLITYVSENTRPTGFGSVFGRQYNPNYNRLLLKGTVRHNPANTNESPSYWKELNKLLDSAPLILDIALVDHEIKKNDLYNSAEVVIDYRGYIDSALADPSMDALAGPNVLTGRVSREMQLRKAVEGGCTIDELRVLKETANLKAKEDIKMTMSRIIKSLKEKNRLFDLRMPKNSVLDALGVDNQGIENPKIINDYIKEKKVVSSTVNDLTIMLQNHMKRQEAIRMTPEDRAMGTTAGETGREKDPTKDAAFGVIPERDDEAETYWTQKWFNLFEKQQQGEAVQKKSLDKLTHLNLTFFFLGDLFDIILDSIYVDIPDQKFRNIDATFEFPVGPTKIDNFYQRLQERSGVGQGIFTEEEERKIITNNEAEKEAALKDLENNDYNYILKPQPTKIITPTFKWTLPNYDDPNQPLSFETNLADIPISLTWFMDWFRSEILDKNLVFYPVATFVKSISQTIITKLLNEVCFTTTEDDKILFRTTADIGLFSGGTSRSANLKARSTNVDALLQGYLAQGQSFLSKDYLKNYSEFPLIKKSVNAMRDEYCQYYIVYPANARGFDYQFSHGNRSYHLLGVPEFRQRKSRAVYVGSESQPRYVPATMIDKISFKKKDAPYRREVKFTTSNQGNLAQIAGVYNATIVLSSPAFFLYPGMLCWVDAGLKDKPNNPNSIAFALGIGGYYQIVQVKHQLEFGGGVSPIGKTIVEATWVNYGIKDEFLRKNAILKKDSFTTRTAECQTVLEELAQDLERTRDAFEMARSQYYSAIQSAQGAFLNLIPDQNGLLPGESALVKEALDLQFRFHYTESMGEALRLGSTSGTEEVTRFRVDYYPNAVAKEITFGNMLDPQNTRFYRSFKITTTTEQGHDYVIDQVYPGVFVHVYLGGPNGKDVVLVLNRTRTEILFADGNQVTEGELDGEDAMNAYSVAAGEGTLGTSSVEGTLPSGETSEAPSTTGDVEPEATGDPTEGMSEDEKVEYYTSDEFFDNL